MNWSNEWKNSPGFAEKFDKYFEEEAEKVKADLSKIDGSVNDPEWEEHVEINGGINPISLGVKPEWTFNLKDCFILIAVKLVIPIKDEWPRTVEAVQVGDLAVHQDLKVVEAQCWQVTHVPTLSRFNAVPDGLYTKADLIEWCKKVQSRLSDDWKVLAGLTVSCYKNADVIFIHVEAKDRIFEMCQATKVG